jgi:hypothetical protein
MTPKQALPKEISSNQGTTKQDFQSVLDSKVPVWVFVFALSALGYLLGILFNQINSIKDNELKDLHKRLTVLETKFDFCQNSYQIKQEDLEKRLSDINTKFNSRPDSSQEVPLLKKSH